MTALTPAAKQTLRNAGISAAEWIRNGGAWPPRTVWENGEWREPREWLGDACGCDDDRCIDYHHEPHEECGCLPALIEQYRRDQHADILWSTYQAAAEEQDQDALTAVHNDAAEWVRRYFPLATSFAFDVVVKGHEGISITYALEGRPVPGWAVSAGEDEYRIIVWADPQESRTENPSSDREESP